MTTTKLKLTAGTCLYKINAYKVIKANPNYTNERIKRCLNCDESLESKCDDFFPIYRTQESFRRGANCCLGR